MRLSITVARHDRRQLTVVLDGDPHQHSAPSTPTRSSAPRRRELVDVLHDAPL